MVSRGPAAFHSTGLTRRAAFKHFLACGSMVLPILCVRFFRAEKPNTNKNQVPLIIIRQ
jgi:hypothetical protein